MIRRMDLASRIGGVDIAREVIAIAVSIPGGLLGRLDIAGRLGLGGASVNSQRHHIQPSVGGFPKDDRDFLACRQPFNGGYLAALVDSQARDQIDLQQFPFDVYRHRVQRLIDENNPAGERRRGGFFASQLGLGRRRGERVEVRGRERNRPCCEKEAERDQVFNGLHHRVARAV